MKTCSIGISAKVVSLVADQCEFEYISAEALLVFLVDMPASKANCKSTVG